MAEACNIVIWLHLLSDIDEGLYLALSPIYTHISEGTYPYSVQGDS